METNWLILIPGFIGLVSLAVFFIIRNLKDKKEFMRDLIENDGVPLPKGNDTEVNSSD